MKPSLVFAVLRQEHEQQMSTGWTLDEPFGRSKKGAVFILALSHWDMPRLLLVNKTKTTSQTESANDEFRHKYIDINRTSEPTWAHLSLLRCDCQPVRSYRKLPKAIRRCTNHLWKLHLSISVWTTAHRPHLWASNRLLKSLSIWFPSPCL
jgi:hypothetical protein